MKVQPFDSVAPPSRLMDFVEALQPFREGDIVTFEFEGERFSMRVTKTTPQPDGSVKVDFEPTPAPP